MSRQEAIEIFAKEVFNGNQSMSCEDFDSLIARATTEKERDFYVYVYNYVLAKKAREAINNGTY